MFFQWGLWVYHATNFIDVPAFYSHITCLYIRNKIKRLNQSLLETETPILSTLKSMDLLYKEIDGYNRQFWSKYFLNFWFLFGSLVVVLLYSTAFVPMFFIFKICFYYILISLMIFFLFVILNVSSVNSESKKSYKILNSLYVSYYSNQRKRIRGKRIPLRALRTQLKV